MKPLLLLALFGALLFASVNYNASKSNTGNLTIGYPAGVSAAQAGAILKDLDKLNGKTPDEAAVRAMLQNHGVAASLIRKIVIEPGKGSATILLLADPADEATARGAVGKVTATSPK